MEKHKLFVNNPMTATFPLAMEGQSTTDHLPNTFFNWDNNNSMDQTPDPFESALSSIVSSPVASTNAADNNFTIRELIGRLGNICNSGEISSHSSSYVQTNNSTNASCYSTPLNSPPKLNLSMMDSSQMRGNLSIPNKTHLPNHPNLAQLAADPAFAERAARFSSFLPSRNLGTQINNNNNGMELGVNSDKKLSRLSRSSSPERGEIGDSKEESSLSEQIPGGENSNFKSPTIENSRKRKAASRGKAKETPPPSSSINDPKVGGGNEESNNAKRSKQEEKNGGETEKNTNDGAENQNKDNSKPPEPPKDYIHVRARRGQATDSHSLAERVRREKISERMKFLQDLVPGCNKVTGKAVMLDEIINYVQSLQRQVEFLSMKLATVNPRMDFNMEALLSKDMYQSHGSAAQYNTSVESSAPTFPYGYPQPTQFLPNNVDSHFSVNPLNPAFHRSPNTQTQLPPIHGYPEVTPQVPSYWDDDLQSLIQMGFNTENQPQSFPGSSSSAQTKVEL